MNVPINNPYPEVILKDLLGFGNKELDITCPQCRKKFKETLARLNNTDQITCSGCGLVFKTDEFNPIDVIDKEIEDFKGFLDNLNKGL